MHLSKQCSQSVACRLLYTSISYALIFSCFQANALDENDRLFMKNEGQWQKDILFSCNVRQVGVNFLRNGISYGISRDLPKNPDGLFQGSLLAESAIPSTSIEKLVWNVHFENCNNAASIKSIGESLSNTHYFRGNDPLKWVVNSKKAKEIVYENIYDGIDLRYYYVDVATPGGLKRTESQGFVDLKNILNGELKYDFIVNQGGDIRNIRLKYEGIRSLRLNDLGQLEISTEWSTYKEEAPYCYQYTRGIRNEVNVEYQLLGSNSVGFKVNGTYDKTKPLIIDPLSLVWSTYMKVNTNLTANYSNDIDVGPDGSIYMTGRCDAGYPTTVGVYQPAYGGGTLDAYVTKLNKSGTSKDFTTYIGGPGGDKGLGIKVNNIGEIFICGESSVGFPVVGGFQAALAGGTDAFIAKFNSTGTVLIYSSYLGGDGYDSAKELVLNAGNEVVLAGSTKAFDFPVQNALFASYGGGTSDAFICKINAAGNAKVFCTFLGGSGYESMLDVGLDSNSDIIVCGYTSSDIDYPLLNAFQSVYGGGNDDGVITKLNSSGNAILYSSYLGGNDRDQIWAMDLSSSGELFVTGYTFSGDFPILSPFQSTIVAERDAFIARFDVSFQNLIYSTLLGGSSYEFGVEILVNQKNEVFVSGVTRSDDLVTTADAFQPVYGGGFDDIFLLHLAETGDTLGCGGLTYLGGDSYDYYGAKMYLDESGIADTIIISGTTHSDNFPTTPGAYEEVKINGTGDQPVVLKFASCAACVSPEFSKSDESCNDGSDALAIAIGQGVGPWNYVWTSGTTTLQSSAEISGSDTLISVGAGIYAVIITDSIGCMDTVEFIITEPAELVLTGNNTNATCNVSDGTASVDVAGGTPSYIYDWIDNGNQTTDTITGLGAGVYTVVVTDGNGCIDSMDVLVSDFPSAALVLSSDSAVCNGDANGSAVVTPTGTGPFTYSWSSGGIDSTETGLLAGSYTVTVTDGNSCVTIESINVSEPATLTSVVNPTDASCGNSDGQATATPLGGIMPYTYAWDNDPPQGVNTVDTLSPGPHTVTITDNNGCDTTYAFTIINPNAPSLNLSQTAQIQCYGDSNAVAQANPAGGTSPFTYSWNDPQNQNTQTATNLPPGTYTVTVTDDNNCQVQQSITISEPQELISQITSIDARCDSNNGTATASANGGTGEIIYQWSPPAGGVPNLTGLAPGMYTVTITDDNGCINTEMTTIIMASSNPTVTAWPDTTIIQGAIVQVNSSGGDTCLWVPSAGLSSGTDCNPTASPNQTTTYIVEVTKNNCKSWDTITIVVVEGNFTLYIPNSFTPNKDGINDFFAVKGSMVENYHIRIFNRWGEIIYESFDMNNPWDGKYQDKEDIQEDIYVYHLTAKSPGDGEEYNYVGNISVIR